MARNPSARVVLNRARLSKVEVALADGLAAVARTIVETAHPPDATPFGEGLVTNGGWLAYIGDKKIGGGGTDGKQPRKPRALKVRGMTHTVAIAGFGFPGRFQEWGTVKQPARPWFTPAVQQVLPAMNRIMGAVVRGALARLP